MPDTLHRWQRIDMLLLPLLLALALLLACWLALAVRSATFAPETPPVLLPLEDMHAVEHLPDEAGSFRWSRGTSSLSLPNPGGAGMVQMRLAGGPAGSVPLEVRAGARTLRFEVRREWRDYTLALALPQSTRVELAFTAPTIAADNRTLGVMVGPVQITGRGALPGLLVAALLLATVSGYLLLRQARSRPLSAAVLVVVAQGAALLWYQAGGWRYGLVTPALLLVALAGLGTLLLNYWLTRRGKALHPANLPDPPGRAAVLRHWPLLAAVLLLALAARLPWLNAPDPVGDLELAARRMGLLYEHGLAGAYRQDGDYMPLRLYLLWGLSQLVVPLGGSFADPLPFVTKLLIKLPGLLADLTVIGLLYAWSLRWLAPWRAAAVAVLYALAPPVWINVAWWGQVDALLLLPLVAMVLLLGQAGGRWSWLAWTTALLIKPQAIIFAPLLYAATLRLHGSRGIAQGGALALGLCGVGCVPLIVAGQGSGLAQAYLGSVGRFPQLTAGAYNLWYLVTGGSGAHDPGQAFGGLCYRLIGMLLVGSVAVLVGFGLLLRADGLQRARAAAVLALAFFVLPTQIHERYLFLSLAFVALLIPTSRHMVILFIILSFSALLNILGTLDGFVPLATVWLADSPVPLVLALVNLGALLWLGGHFGRQSLPTSRRSSGAGSPWVVSEPVAESRHDG